jgi:hypothetical protein
LQIANGSIKLDRAELATEGGRAIVDTVIDIASLKVDSEWRIEPAPRRTGAAGDARPALPAIALVYAGSLGRTAAIEPRLDTEALERELAIRRMERDVEELERLRRIDEERARQELERLKRIEAERAAAQQPVEGAASVAPAAAQPAPSDTPIAPDNQPPLPAGAGSRAPAAGSPAPRPKPAPFRPFSDTGSTQSIR